MAHRTGKPGNGGGQSGGMIIWKTEPAGGEKLQKIFMIVFVAALAVVVAVCSASFGNERRVPVYGVDTDEKKVAISFDAAWGNEFTAGILDILDTYDVKATFFSGGFLVSGISGGRKGDCGAGARYRKPFHDASGYGKSVRG